MKEPRFRQGDQKHTFKVEGTRLYANVNVHTLWADGSATEKSMPLYEALQYQSDFWYDTKAITIYPDRSLAA